MERTWNKRPRRQRFSHCITAPNGSGRHAREQACGERLTAPKGAEKCCFYGIPSSSLAGGTSSALPSLTIVPNSGSRAPRSSRDTALTLIPHANPRSSCVHFLRLRSRRTFSAKVASAACVMRPNASGPRPEVQGQDDKLMLRCRAISEPQPARGFVVKRSLSCRCVVVLVVAATIATASLGGSVADASALGWSAPLRIDATESPRPYPSPMVSCATVSFCLAVDLNSNAMVYDGSSWTAPASIKGSFPGGELLFYSVSCPTTSFCMAVGSGEYATYSAGSWSQPASLGGAWGVSCPSSSFCAAVNHEGALTYNGSSWTSPTDLGGSGEFGYSSVSCVSASFCMAVDYEGHAVTYNGSTWSAPANIDGTEGIGGVGCVSSSFCMAVDWGGNALTYNGSTWSAPSHIDNNVLTSVSCPTSSFCAAVGNSGNALTYNGSSWTTSTAVYGGSEGASVSCPTTSFCVATEAHGNAFMYGEYGTPGGGESKGEGPSVPSGSGGSPIITPTVTPHHRLHCKRGYRKVRKHGKARCVRRKGHKHTHRAR